MAAGQLVDVPSVAEIESQKDRFNTDRWDQLRRERSRAWNERNQVMSGMSEEERTDYTQANRNIWEEEENAAREASQAEMAEFARKLNEDLRNQKLQQERLAFILSRFSPASAFQLTAMNAGGTNTKLKTRYEDAMRAYRTTFTNFVESKREEERRANQRSSGGGFVSFGSGNEEALDVGEMPRFEAPTESFNEAIQPSMIDFGLLALFSVVAFAGAFAAFLRYDVR
jgi:hypothetical protein